MAVEPNRVAIVGSGFASSILSRILSRLGHRVVMIEKAQHPRFALGESSTPLAALSLERLAARYDLADLHHLAAWGRWRRSLPRLRCGLKRGFTFYSHTAGEVYSNTADNDRRLLVAASPDDASADCHWLRSDVDEFLVRLAIRDGVEYHDATTLESIGRTSSGDWKLSGECRGKSVVYEAEYVLDGSGQAGFLADHLGLSNQSANLPVETSLVFGHFENVLPTELVLESDRVNLPTGPYPDEQAAVHHLLEEGWLYLLRFDDGLVSAGVSIDRNRPIGLNLVDGRSPDRIWKSVLSQYPTLRSQFSQARAVRPIEMIPRVQHWLDHAAGPGWALLPHTYAFFDPMFSTGIAWSLLAVERLALIFEEQITRGGGRDFDRYEELLRAEATQILNLIEGAYLAMGDFDRFCSQSFLYFATVSYLELEQRLKLDSVAIEEMAWRGFLGAGTRSVECLFNDSTERLRDLAATAESSKSPADPRSFGDWVEAEIESRNVIGLADSNRKNLYPVDLEVLIRRAGRLGLSANQMRSKLHLLRG